MTRVHLKTKRRQHDRLIALERQKRKEEKRQLEMHQRLAHWA